MGLQVVDTETVLQKMLLNMQKHGRRVLRVIDEAMGPRSMREFALAFQILLMHAIARKRKVGQKTRHSLLPSAGPSSSSGSTAAMRWAAFRSR